MIFNLEKKSSSYKNKYKNYTSRKMIKVFQNVFLKKNVNQSITILDKFINLMSFSQMLYLYLRHKFYEHYFNLFESKFIR